MFLQIFIGTSVMMVTILIGALSALLMEIGFSRWRFWLMREPHRPKLTAMVMAIALWVLGTITAGVWLWACVFWLLGAFVTMEASVYFALVTYTTLGFGDVLLPHQWRILAGMASANGLLNFGLMTALLVEALRHVRISQVNSRLDR